MLVREAHAAGDNGVLRRAHRHADVAASPPARHRALRECTASSSGCPLVIARVRHAQRHQHVCRRQHPHVLRMLPVRVGHPVLYRPLAPLRVRHAPQARLCRVPGQDCRVVCLNPRVGVPAVSLKHRQLHTAVFMRLRTVRGGGQHVRRARAQAKAKVLQNTSLTRWTAANTTPSSPVGTATTSYSSSGSLASAAAAAGGGVKRAGRAPDDSTAPTPPRTATRGHGGPAGTCSCGCACLIVDTGRHSALCHMCPSAR